MLCDVLNKSRKRHATKQYQYDHLPSITQTIQIRLTGHAGHCWGSNNELNSEALALAEQQKFTYTSILGAV